jgi:hypothetical protein
MTDQQFRGAAEIALLAFGTGEAVSEIVRGCEFVRYAKHSQYKAEWIEQAVEITAEMVEAAGRWVTEWSAADAYTQLLKMQEEEAWR